MEYNWYYEWSYCREKPQLAENEILIRVPFIGTYEALDRLIDSECEREAEYLEEYPQEGYEDGFYASFDMHSFLLDYVGEISDICKLPSLKFQYLSSPREYNFSTDKIICSVDRNELWELYSERLVMTDYGDAVRAATTPRSGYSTFYDEDDCFYESVDDFVDNSAVLGLILEAYLNCWLSEEVYDYCEDLLNPLELFLHMNHGYENLYEYIHF